MENKRILLPTKRYFKAEEQDLDLRINLEKEEILLYFFLMLYQIDSFNGANGAVAFSNEELIELNGANEADSDCMSLSY